MKSDSKRANVYLIIIVMLIIALIILSYYTINNFGKIGYIPTGNIDIIEIKCDNNKSEVCEPTFGENSYKVYDDNITWDANTELNIFTNPAYEFKNIIAPGTSNSYQFVILNSEKYNIKYNLKFIEENIHDINMQFKLRRNKEYVLGDSDTWKSLKDLKNVSFDLMGNDHDTFLLDWKWVNNKNDTKVSFAEANYKLSINITATS